MNRQPTRRLRDWLAERAQPVQEMVDLLVNGSTVPPLAAAGAGEGDPAEEGPAFRVGMLGPSRVGKTSLIAAMLTDSEISLSGTHLVLRPADATTQRILRLHREQLEGGLLAGRFKTEVMPHSARATTFTLTLRHSQAERGIQFSLLDFPGGWLKGRSGMGPDGTTPLSQQELAEWEQVRGYLTECNVLVIPVDAMILMTAVKERQRGSIPAILEILAVQEIIEEWAKYRREREDEPALVILAPVNGERYFADNGGRFDESDLLRERTLRSYARPIELVRSGAPHAKLLYCPVDTLGCVELVRAVWHPVEDRPDIEKPTGVFAVRRGGADGASGYPISVVGADDILTSVCRMLAESQARIAEAAAGWHESRARQAGHVGTDLSTGYFRRLWNTYNGRIARAERLGRLSGERAVREREFAAQLAESVNGIAERRFGPRSRTL